MVLAVAHDYKKASRKNIEQTTQSNLNVTRCATKEKTTKKKKTRK